METTIDQAAVEMVLGQVAGATTAQVEVAATRFERMAAAGRSVTDDRGVTLTPATMTEIASRLRLHLAASKPAPAMTPPTTPAGYTRVRISATGREFGKAVKWAKDVRRRDQDVVDPQRQ